MTARLASSLLLTMGLLGCGGDSEDGEPLVSGSMTGDYDGAEFVPAFGFAIDGENGILYPDTDVASLAAALNRVASTRFDSDRIRRTAQQFSRENHVPRLREVIDETVAAPTGARW